MKKNNLQNKSKRLSKNLASQIVIDQRLDQKEQKKILRWLKDPSELITATNSVILENEPICQN